MDKTKNRVIMLQVVIALMLFILCTSLFNIQVRNEELKISATNNVLQRVTLHPYRGLIVDRNNYLIAYNDPVYNLMVTPRNVQSDNILGLCSLLRIDRKDFMKRLQKARVFSRSLPSIFMKTIPNHEFAQIEDKLVAYQGFQVVPHTVRGYTTDGLANLLGYVGEVSSNFLEKDTSGYYSSGDKIGITGIERHYESYLRGKRGVALKVVDVQGQIKGDFKNGALDSLPKSGKNIQLTIDLNLQAYAEKLMRGKVGSVVALEPGTGEILALLSSPSYSPSDLSGKYFQENYSFLVKDKNKPLYNRAIQAKYPPGSLFKTLQAVIALHMKVTDTTEKIRVKGNLIGDTAPPGIYDLEKSLIKSSNNYYYIVMRRMIEQKKQTNKFLDAREGLKEWSGYVKQFGLGQKLGIDMPNETKGFVPNLEYYDKIYGKNRWKYSNIASLSIGQGELLVTPLQMTNLGAVLANRGFYITPHLVKNIETEDNREFEKHMLPFDPIIYDPVIDAMEQVVIKGSGFRAYRDSLFMCGKTSTVENPHGENHSGFMGFASKDDPKIVVVAYVENAGMGARAAASISSLVAEKYVFGKVKRKYLEKYILEERYLPKKKEKTGEP